MEHTQITCLSRKVRDHLSGLAHMANAMTCEVTHYTRPVLHMAYVHAFHTIMPAHKHKVTKSMFTPVLKSIN